VLEYLADVSIVGPHIAAARQNDPVAVGLEFDELLFHRRYNCDISISLTRLLLGGKGAIDIDDDDFVLVDQIFPR